MADEDDDYTDEASEAVELPEAPEFVTNKGRPGRAPSTAKVPDQDPENIAWRLQGRASRCGQDAIRIGVQFVRGAQVAQPLPSPDAGPRRSSRANIASPRLRPGLHRVSRSRQNDLLTTPDLVELQRRNSAELLYNQKYAKIRDDCVGLAYKQNR